MKLKQKLGRSESTSTRNSAEPHDESPGDSSTSPRFLSIFRSKISSGRKLKLMFRNLGKKKAKEGNSQTRWVRCPKCKESLQEPDRCSRCNTVLHANHWRSEGQAAQMSDSSVPEATLLSAQECESSTTATSSAKSSKKKTSHVYDEAAAASYSGQKSSDSKTANKHNSSDVQKEWMTSEVYSSSSVKGRDKTRSQAPSYSMSPSPSYPYECSSPFHASHGSTSEQTYNHHHRLNYLRQHETEELSRESSGSSSTHFHGETLDARYHQWSGQSPMHDQGLLGRNFYDFYSSCTTTPHRSEHSYPTRSYQTWSCSGKSTHRDMNEYSRERTPVMKRHVPPAAGGAPFVTCYYCLEVLQLSHGFPYSNEKKHLVRCGSCSGLLKFSLQQKAHTKSYTPTILDSYPIHVDDNVSNHQDDHDSASVESPPLCSNVNDGGDPAQQSNASKDDEIVSPSKFDVMEVKEETKNIPDESSKAVSETPQSLLEPLDSLPKESCETSEIHLEQSQNAHSKHSWSEYEHDLDNTISDLDGSVTKTLEASNMVVDGTGVSVEDVGYDGRTAKGDTSEETSASRMSEPVNENEISCVALELKDNTGESHKFDLELSQEEGNSGGKRTWEETMGDRPGLHIEEYESNYYSLEERLDEKPESNYKGIEGRLDEKSQWSAGEYASNYEGIERRFDENIEWNDGEYGGNYRGIERRLQENSEWNIGEGRVPTFRLDESELEKLHEQGKETEGSIMETSENEGALRSEKYDNESRAEVSMQEEALAEMLIQLDLSRQTLEFRALEEDKSMSSSGTIIQPEVETAAEHKSADHSKRLQEDDDDDDMLGLTFKPSVHLGNRTDPSEVVGLRHALYTAQSLPLRSPFTSPLFTPVSSPRAASPLHSPMASPLHSHIVSPLRSPIRSQPSLSDALFFSKNSR